MATVFLNGRLLRDDDPSASVSLSDAGFMHGVGLFETMTARRTEAGVRVMRVEEHGGRLVHSAKEFGLASSLKAGPLAEAVEHTAQAHLDDAPYDAARVRLTVTGGDLNLVRREAERVGAGAQTPTVAILAQQATEYPQALYEQGGVLVIGDAKANPFDPTSGHKTLDYWWRLRELQNALGKGGTEALLFTVTNHVCGGSVSNVFVVKDDAVLTPIARGEESAIGGSGGVMPSPVLPGVTRAAVLEQAASMGLAVRKQWLTIDDVLDADEVFCTNASFGVLPMSHVEGKPIADGRVGQVTQRVRARMLEIDGD